jgi:hypothetical protein
MRESRPRRIVVFPYGQPVRQEHRDLCAATFLKLDGDLQRVIDGPFPSIDRFVRHACRIETIARGAEEPIVVLTDTQPLEDKVIGTRRRLELALAGFRRATWLVFVDLTSNREFLRDARRFGSMERSPEGLLWCGPDDQIYVLVVATTQPQEAQAMRSSRPAAHDTQKLGRIYPTPPPLSGPRLKTPQLERGFQDQLAARTRRATTRRGRTS